MLTLILSLMLACHLMGCPAHFTTPESPEVQSVPVLWGMIDPELSKWFSRVPRENKPGKSILWDFSWRGFFAALTGQPLLTEGDHAPLA